LARRVWRVRLASTLVSDERGQLGALVGRQLSLGGLDRPNESELKVGADPFCLADLGLDLRRVDLFVRVSIDQSPEVEPRDHEVGLTPNRLAEDVETETLEAFHLCAGQAQLLLVIEHHADDRERAAWVSG
jgi:hypothetical protein